MTSKDSAAADLQRSSERWLAWLARETARRQHRPESALQALWDALDEWLASDEFAGAAVAWRSIRVPAMAPSTRIRS